MKTWTLMYAMIWVAFFQILIILFPVLGAVQAYIHEVIGVLVLVLAYMVSSRVGASEAPKRVKLIARTTLGLAAFQGAMGAVLAATMNAGGSLSAARNVVEFIHAATALAIITQASSSATAFDMWEEKEFETSQQGAGAAV